MGCRGSKYHAQNIIALHFSYTVTLRILLTERDTIEKIVFIFRNLNFQCNQRNCIQNFAVYVFMCILLVRKTFIGNSKGSVKTH